MPGQGVKSPSIPENMALAGFHREDVYWRRASGTGLCSSAWRGCPGIAPGDSTGGIASGQTRPGQPHAISSM